MYIHDTLHIFVHHINICIKVNSNKKIMFETFIIYVCNQNIKQTCSEYSIS